MDDLVAYYVKAFFQISRSRPHSMGSPGYLSLGAIADYMRVFGEPYDVEEFAEIIYAMDMEYIPVAHRKQKQTSKTPPGDGERRPMLPPARGR